MTWNRKPARRSLAAVAAAALVALLTSTVGATPPPPPPISSGAHPWIVALCKFTDLSTEPSTYTPSYFSQMFSGTGSSSLDFVDWWSQISYGNIDVSGTKVTTQWWSLGMTRFEWAGLNRYDKIKACGDAAANDANIGNDYSKFYGIIAIFNDDTLPGAGTPARTASTTLASGNLNTSDTSITVTSSAGFPAPPFAVTIDDGSLPNGGNAEELHVIGVSGTNWTLSTRGYEGTTPKTHLNGAAISLIDGGDLGAADVGTHGITLNGKSYNLGLVVLPPETNMGAAQHETGHGFGYDHSRALSTPTSDYQDCYDIMSFDVCRNGTSSLYNFQGDFGAAGVLNDSLPAAVGPGLNAIDLDIQNWMPGGRTYTFSPGSCTTTTRDLAALNHPEASGDMEIRIPASVVIPLPTPPGGTTTSDYYTIELRDKSFWDRGIPQNAVLLHLHGLNKYPYWVDQVGGSFVGHSGAFYLGDQYVDTANNVVVAVNRMDTSAHTATVALAAGAAGCKIAASMTYSGDTTGDYNDQVTLAGDLTVSGTSVPIPGKTVTLSLGTQSCVRTTDATGHASCTITITQDPGTYTATGSFAGDSAYSAASDPDTNNFTITQEESQLAYTGALTSDYHDPFTASATLTDPDGGAPIAGKPITFTLGGSSTDTCGATTNAFGVASCQITSTQASGSVSIVASFAGDVDYVSSSDTKSFAITTEETTVTYTGPTVILQGSSGVTLQALLVEDGANDNDGDGGSPAPVPSGRAVTLSLGSQSCIGLTDASGVASCAIVFVGPLGPEPLKAEFLGDVYYSPSSDTSKTAVVFAFPSRGAFVLGDNAVAAAGLTQPVTWWSSQWPSLNGLSGGTAPASFKGFAGDVTTLPDRSPANVCGTTFTTKPGNSTPPTSTVPSYMGVLVASSVTKSGSAIDGTWGKIVVVKTDPGYEPNPGHAGTGTVVATFCP
jgi:hypothetical protein